jgi:hypothetical protein
VAQEKEWSPRPGGAGVGGAGARGGAVGVELRRTRLGHVQVRRDKAGASAGPATGGGGVAAQGDGVQDDGVQGGHVLCERSCSAAAAGGSAREQWSRAWRTSRRRQRKARP